MSKLKRNLLTISLVLLSGGATAEKVQSQTAVDAVTSKELTAIAEAAVTSETEVKVTGDVDAALKKTPLALQYQAAVQNKLTKNKDVRAFLVNRGEGYTGVNTKLQVQNVQVNGNTATVDATEHTEYGLRDPEMIKENKKYEYNLPHRFTFTLQNGQWMLASDKVLQGPDAEPDHNNPPPAPQGTAPAGAVKLQLDAPSPNNQAIPL